jgi:sialate O-acetylesterase
MRPVKAVLLALSASVLALGTARADVKPHPIFSDNMVLQQGTDVVVWGKADPGEKVTVELGKAAAAAAPASAAVEAGKDGKWSVKLPKQAAGAGYMLAVRGKNTAEFKNVAVGEVWVCSGQSNMQWEFWRPNHGEQGKTVPANSKNPNIRLITLKRVTATTPQYDFPVVTEPREGTKGAGPKVHYGTWLECDQPAVQEFSAVAYYFGRELEKELKVPVGLIVNSWGGMPAESYTSLEALDAVPELKYLADRARGAAKEFELNKRPAAPNTPTVLYNSMVHPILNFPVKGAIWYQGESNAGRAFEYRTLFPAMIKDWRARWHSELPFMCVQLAPFRGGASGVDYAELRDAQLLASKKLPKVGIAVITDAGHETDIHPPQKDVVGLRLAKCALALAYEKKVPYLGPELKEAKFGGDTATLTFDHAEGGLVAKGSEQGEVAGFAAAGPDNAFHPAKAVVKGDTVVVTSPDVKEIKAVRYGWVNFAKPTLNLFNKAGLPASPFRTDDLPLTTTPKKK